MRLRRVLAALSLLLCGCPGPPVPRAVKPPAPRLVVLIVVDQLPVWVFERDRGEFRHGLARLQREAAYAVVELPYANTFTAPGHATIGTGAPPSVHGVLANQWYRRSEGSEQAAEYDPAAPVFAVGVSHGQPLTANHGASARQLRVGGIADRLREIHPRARSVSIGLKPRGATLMTGRRPDLAVWYEAGAGGMTTSAAYATQVPRWLVELARTRPPSRFLGATWTPLDPAQLARVTGIPDHGPGESAVHGMGTGFPHTVSSDPKHNRSLLVTPFADEVVLDAVLAAIPAMGLGDDDTPDLLAVTFSAHDYAGHMWGPDSWEVLDLTLRLDMLLGRLFETLDRQLGADGWAVVLTSDHGATPLVERARAAGARRIRPDEVATLAESAVVAAHGPGPWVAAVSSNNVYFTAKLGELAIDQQLAALDAAGFALTGLPGVAAAGAIRRIAGRCDKRAALPRAICWSVVDRESGDLYILPQAGTVISNYDTGTGHDSPFEDNRHVPVFVRAPGLRPQTGKGSLLQIAPTVTALLGVPPPEAATAPPLFGVR